MNYVLIQKKDIKSRGWQQGLEKLDVECVLSEGSPIKLPLQLISSMFRRGMPKCVVYRYLNDYPSLVKTVVRLASEAATVVVCKCLGVRLVWICHNIDRESIQNHVGISHLRRRLFSGSVKHLMVTDPGLVDEAVDRFPNASIAYVTFGDCRSSANGHDKAFLDSVETFVQRERSNPRAIIGWTAGICNWKTAHFDRAIQLIDAAEQEGVAVRLIIVIANPKDADPTLIKRLEQDPRIYLHLGKVDLDETQIAQSVDFYWRVYRDLSVPLSLYVAASVGKPILTQDEGFLGKAVRAHNLGSCLDRQMSNLKDAIGTLDNWDSKAATKFLDSHNWDVAATRLKEKCLA